MYSHLCHQSSPVCGFMRPPSIVRQLAALLLLICAVTAPGAAYGQDDAGVPVLPPEDSSLTDEITPEVQQDKWPRDTAERKQPSVESWSISEIHATGKVTKGFVQLQLTIRVVVQQGSDWVRIPIELPSWQIQDYNTTLDGEPSQSILAPDAARQRIWSLKGEGDHLLTLQLIGEVLAAEPGRRSIRMSLPEALVSDLKLTFLEPIEASIQSNAAVGPTAMTDSEQAEFQFWGLPQETNVSWQPAVPAGETATVIRALKPASMVLDLRTSVAELTCVQEIRVESGAVDRLEVRLPPGYGEVAVTARDENGLPINKAGDVLSGDDSEITEIRFRKPVTGDVKLEYNLAMATTAYPQEIVVTVPDIESVDDESGRVEVLIPRGLNVKEAPGLLTRRDSVESPSDLRHDATAYLLMSTKAELRLNVSEIYAHFGVDPEIEISTTGETLLMLAQFKVNVSQGSLAELDILWEEFTQDGWQIQPQTTSLRNDAGGVSQPLTPDRTGDRIKLTLGDYQSGRFIIEFRAFRSFTEADASQHKFHLPDVPASTSHPTTVTLIESDDFSLSLSVADAEARVSTQVPELLNDPQQPARATSWLVTPSGSEVQIQQTPQTTEVSATAVIALEPGAAKESIHVHGEFSINVRHQDLNELRMVVPTGILPTVRVVLNDRSEQLPPGRTSGNDTVWAMPESTPRQLVVEVDYFWQLEVGADVQRLPLVLPSQGLESLTIGTDSPQQIQVADETGLKVVYPLPFQAAWHGTEFRSEVSLNVAPMMRSQNDVPALAVVRTEVNSLAIVSTTAAIYASPPRDVLFRVTVGSTVTAVAVNGANVPVSEVDRVVVDAVELWRVPTNSIPRTGAVRVALTATVLRSPHHHLLSTATAVYPRVQSAPDWLPTFWIVGAPDDTCMVAMKRTTAPLVRPSILRFLSSASSRQVPEPHAIDSLITGFSEQVQEHFQEELSTPTVGGIPSFMYMAGPQLREVPVLVFSRAAGWLVAAAAGIVFYLLLIRFGPHIRTVALVCLFAGAVIWLVTPPQYLELLFALVPAVLVAAIGWGMRQVMEREVGSRRSAARQGSVFAAVRPGSSSSRSGVRLSAAAKGSQPEIMAGS